MQSAGTIRPTRQWTRDEDNKILTPDGQYNQSHSDWKLINQMRALKQQFGLGSILGTLAIIIAIGAPAVKQGELNGTYATSIDRLAAAQKENKDEQARALADAVARIETGIKAVDVGQQQNRDEMRSMRESNERQIVELRTQMVELRQKADSLWNWMGQINNRVGVVEAETKKKEPR